MKSIARLPTDETIGGLCFDFRGKGIALFPGSIFCTSWKLTQLSYGKTQRQCDSTAPGRLPGSLSAAKPASCCMKMLQMDSIIKKGREQACFPLPSFSIKAYTKLSALRLLLNANTPRAKNSIRKPASANRSVRWASKDWPFWMSTMASLAQ